MLGRGGQQLFTTRARTVATADGFQQLETDK